MRGIYPETDVQLDALVAEVPDGFLRRRADLVANRDEPDGPCTADHLAVIREAVYAGDDEHAAHARELVDRSLVEAEVLVG